MNNMEFTKKLVAMRNSIQDYLDQLDMDEVDEKPEPKGSDKKPEKKPEPKGSDKKPEKKPDPEEDEDGKKKEH